MDIKNLNGDVIHTTVEETLAGVDFYKASFPQANFEGADLVGSRFYSANLAGANFHNAKAKSVDFQIANLTGANLSGADLSYTNMLDTNLSDADLTDANLKWAVWKGTKYSKETKFPKGFKPQDHEMVLLTETLA